MLDEDKHFTKTEFTITKNHLKLLNRTLITFNPSVNGALSADLKRPYGNSDYLYDVAEIIGMRDPDLDDYQELTEDEEYELLVLHQETSIALQICLIMQEFRVGEFKKKDFFDSLSWYRVND